MEAIKITIADQLKAKYIMHWSDQMTYYKRIEYITIRKISKMVIRNDKDLTRFELKSVLFFYDMIRMYKVIKKPYLIPEEYFETLK